MQTYEYIFSAAIIIAILLASTLLLGIAPQSTINTSEIDQLKMAAQKVLTQLILSPGNPPEWGSNISISGDALQSLGLAVYSPFTSMAYVLDPDKVQRLNPNLPLNLYVTPEQTLKLLNLGRDYGLKLQFIPALNVTLSPDLSQVTVSSDSGYPIEGASITARFFKNSGGQIIGTQEQRGVTDSSGNCMLSPQGNVAVVVVDYKGVQQVKVACSGSCNQAYFVGEYFIPKNQIGSSTVCQVYVSRYANGTYFIGNVTHTASQTSSSPYVYRMDFLEPDVVAVLGASNALEVASKKIPENYSTVNAEQLSPTLSYMLERTVKIGGSLYTLRVQVWRMSW